jgi:DNA polymerase-1
LGLKIKGFLFDTMLMHHILDENPPHGLEPLADVEFNVGDYSAPLHAITGWGKNLLKTFDHVEDDVLWPYGANDSECVYRLCEVYYNRLQLKPHLWKLYCEESEPSIRTLATAEWHGSLIDEKVVLKLKEEYEEAQESLLVKMRKEIPPKPDCPEFQFNPMSTQQVRDAFIDLGFNDLITDKHSPSGYNTSKEVLLKIKEGDFMPSNETASNLAGWILDFRTNRKILSTYLENALLDVDDDGRSRYSWMAHGTTSGRLSCRFLHQIPRASEQRAKEGKLNLRDMFVVRPGYKYVYFDYSQIELRVLALLANDEKMISMFVNDEDIHAATAECILAGLPYSKNKEGTGPSKFNRGVGKTMNFGLAYGSEGHQLVKTGEWEDENGEHHPVTWDMVKLGRANFSNLFPQVVDYLTNTPDIARLGGGTLVTPFGRERRMGSKLNDRLDTTRKAAEREIVNFVIQSTAGAVCVRTLNAIHQQLEQLIDAGHLKEDDAFLINTVHDSGAYEVREDLVEWFNNTIIKPTAERVIPEIQNSYFEIDMGVGNNWTEAEAG